MIYEKHLLRRYAEYFVACSPEAGKWLFGDKICNSEKYLLLKNSIDSSAYSFDEETRNEVRKELGLEGRKVIIHVGQFRTQKNHGKVIEVFNELHKRDDSFALVLVGTGEEQDNIKSKVEEIGLKEDVLFLGNRNDIPELLMSADVFLFPSLYEGLGIALLEAQAADLICVVSDTIPELAILTEKVRSVNLTESASVWGDIVEEMMGKYTV